jgi:hypothetical protein
MPPQGHADVVTFCKAFWLHHSKIFWRRLIPIFGRSRRAALAHCWAERYQWPVRSDEVGLVMAVYGDSELQSTGIAANCLRGRLPP